MSDKAFRTSDETSALYEALAAAQGEFPVVEKSKVGKIQGASKATGKEFSYSYKYADIADVFKAALPILSKYKLCIIQPTCMAEDTLNIVTHLGHASGQWIESDYPVCSITGDHQRMGGALTYAKRQAACALLGIVAEEDTDGAGAEDARPSYQRPKPQPKTAVREEPTQQEKEKESFLLLHAMLEEIGAFKTKTDAAKWAMANEARKGYLFAEHYKTVSEAFRGRLAEFQEKKPPKPADDFIDFEKLRTMVMDALKSTDDIDAKRSKFHALVDPHWADLMPPDKADLETILRRSEAESHGADEDGVIWSEDEST